MYILNFKILFLTSILMHSFFISKAQTVIDCSSLRYDQEIFSSVDVTSDLAYGSNIDVNGNPLVLKLDVYQPAGDTVQYRPLIVWVHGGSFMVGSKTEADVVALSEQFAKRGYVCASISYRLGIPFPPTEINSVQAVYRAVQDMKAAIRFFRKDAATTNTYRIDPNIIFGGGSSAGAFTALHLAYMNEFSEVPSFIDTTLMGNLEGESGNPGYSSDINAVINLCGALGAKETIIPGDIPFVSMHGTNDNTVPYATDTITLLGLFPIMLVDGSYSSNAYASTIGVHNEMYTYYGAGHVPYLGDSAYMDTTVRFVSNFLYDYLSCTPRDLNPLPNTFGITGISDADELTNSISVYPNPATDYIIVESESEIIGYKIFDVSGRLVRSAESTHKSKIRIERHQLKPGYYTLSILTKTGEVPKQIYFGF